MSYEADISKAEVLVEALPFIQKHRGQTFVIKYGGSAMEDEHLVERTLRDVVFLEAVGIRPVLVHGGGKAITTRMREAKIKAQFINGLRVTDAESIAIVASTLEEVINPMIVDQIGRFNGLAKGISGQSVFRARKLSPQRVSARGPAVDLGFVGEVTGVNIAALNQVIADHCVPVVSPLGIDENGIVLNVNADVAAAALASELHAAKLIYISDVRGIMRDPASADSLIPSVTSAQVAKLIEDEIISGGMIPKVQSAVESLGKGVGSVHLVDGRVAHSLLLEVFSSLGHGTEILP